MKYLLTLALCFCFYAASAQTRITGHVVSDEGPIVMANVVEKDGNNRNVSATQTDANGNFSLAIKSTSNSLQISYIGYKTQTIKPIGERKSFEITLIDNSAMEGATVVAVRKTQSNGLSIPEREISVARQTLNMDDMQREEYNNQLRIDGTEVMAYVSMPKFHIKCPIYHGTDEAILQVAVGHLESSSLPVGGESTHTLISGHRGLPSARLFTDIAKMKEGDVWTITVLNETLTYECDQIRVVLPDDLSDLQIEEGKDLCTLITCTPYGINTHRLLVRGHRIPNVDGLADLTADAIQIEPVFIAPFLAVPVLILLIILMLITTRRAKRLNSEDYRTMYLEKKGLKK